MPQNVTIQDRIIEELYLRNAEMDIKKLSDVLKLKDTQVRRAITDLSRRRLISRRYEQNKSGNCSAPYKKVFIKIKYADKVVEVLNRKGML